MPTKRTRKPRHLRVRVTDAAREHFAAGDWMALHRELQLKPWEESPLDVDEHETAEGRPANADTLEQAKALRAELLRGGR
jgi:hypothetical protein